MKKLREFTKELSSRDPHVIFYRGQYYGCFASEGDSLSLICADTIDGLAKAEPHKVYVAEQGRPYSKQLWAPELHIIDGKCYIYVACDDGNNHTHRMYVLENGSDDPLKPYTMHGKISDASDKWAIDGTIVYIGEKRYFIWSGWEGDTNICQDLYIAEMSDPYTISSDRHRIATPTYSWEKLGATGEEESPFINEGPCGFWYKGQLYVTYSAAGSWCEDYCIAMLKLVGDDPLKAESWYKYEMPVFSQNDLVKGAGHCSVIVEEDAIWVFFHAWEKEATDIVWNKVAFWQGQMSFDGELPTVK